MAYIWGRLWLTINEKQNNLSLLDDQFDYWFWFLQKDKNG